MSDWEDDDWNSKPKTGPAPLVKSYANEYDNNEWGDGANHTVRHGRDRSVNRSDHDSGNKRRNNNYMDSSNGQDERLSFTINKSNVGLVIGRGGSKIKELEQTFGVRLNIDKESDADGNSTVTITGDTRNAEDAKREILDLVSSNSNRSNGRNFDRNSDRNFDRNSDRNFDRNSDRNSDRNFDRNSDRNSDRNFDRNSDRNSDRYSDRNSVRNESRGYESRSSEHKDNLEIYPDKVGMVIGRGGATIREVQDKFKVRVNIDKNPNYNGKATVTVSGSHSDVTSAIDHIKELIGDRTNDTRQNNFGASHQNNQASEQQSSFQPDSMDFEPIDWQAAARESEEENRKRWARLPPLQKNFYEEHEDVTNMTPEYVEEIRKQNNNITASRVFLDETGETKDVDPVPNPIEKFEQCFGQYPDLMEQITNQGFTKPSPIQAQAWPVLLKGEDMIGIAQTGTGKTLAFLLPAMIHTEYQSIPRSERNGPNVLVLAPTRELAIQIEKEVAKYSFRGMKSVCVYGGGDRKAQISNIETGVEIIIATPGRLNDLVEANVIDVCTITFLILDEADRMLDMGFEPQIRKVLLNIRPDRQTVMTSATWPAGVRRLAQRYMANPIQICVGTLDLAAVHSVTQVIKIIAEEDKYNEVLNFIKNQMEPEEKAIIFCGKKARADDLSSEFSLEGICCQCIHGNRDQSDREQALVDIRDGVVKVLIATDVASRGIDIPDLSYVINYDFPRNIEEYVHRVGRTGRAGRTGKSISYVTRTDWGSAEELINILEEAEQEVPDELRDMKLRFESMKERREREKQSLGGGGGRRFGGGGGGGGGRFGGGGGGGGGHFGGGGGGGRNRY